jgi:indole-3-glycerol phosphate synthase
VSRFRDALAAPGLAAIAEVKRRSPSAGDLRPDADPAVLAAQFARAGAAAVSILVDERFGGSVEDLRAARSATSAPLLAKGFFHDEAQLNGLSRAGADAVLLLLRDLDDRRAAAMLARTGELGLDALVEAHNADELARAVELGAEVIGINARDLDTFAVDRGAALELVAQAADLAAAPEGRRAGSARAIASHLPRNRLIVAESGVAARAHGAAAELAGADAILVGSALMRAPDPAAKLRELVGRPLVKICGLTREEDVAVAAAAGADLAGFILARETPRPAPSVLPVPDAMLSVAVYVGERGDADSDLAQLYPRENGHRGRDGVLFRDDRQVARVVDRAWQQEDPEHIERARAAEGRIVLAGGLTPENVGEAVAAVRPWAVDASSSLETEPGIKDHERVHAFVEAAR